MESISESILNSLSARMKSTPQQAEWHGEGDVLTHTEMVCEAMCGLPEYGKLSVERQDILLAASRLHDIGKIVNTKEIAGTIESPNHAPAGSRMARERLWKAGMCGSPESIMLRESICQLIRYHSFPPHAIDSEDAIRKIHQIASSSLLAPEFSIWMLSILSKADMLGRICEDKIKMLEQIEMFVEMAEEEGCLHGCYPFPSQFTMHSYLNGRDVWKEQNLYDDTWGTVYMMSGLPGTGKDTWIKENLPDMPMISLDRIRLREKILPTDNQGAVANMAREEAKEYLRRHQSFVWNATNLTQNMRGQLISLFESYNARVHIIYLETDLHKLMERNGSREAVVPQQVIESMLGKLVPPEPFEAAKVEWLTV